MLKTASSLNHNAQACVALIDRQLIEIHTLKLNHVHKN